MIESGLKAKREEKNLSRSQLAKASGVNIRTIEAYEQGLKNINSAKVSTVLALADALGCKIENIIKRREE